MEGLFTGWTTTSNTLTGHSGQSDRDRRCLPRFGLTRVGETAATVVRMEGIVMLFSYETLVAAFVPGRGCFRLEGRQSNTTSRHIRQFFGRNSELANPEALHWVCQHAIFQETLGRIHYRLDNDE